MAFHYIPWIPSSGKNNADKYEWFKHVYTAHSKDHFSQINKQKPTNNNNTSNNKNMQPLNPKRKENRGKNTSCLRKLQKFQTNFNSNHRDV